MDVGLRLGGRVSGPASATEQLTELREAAARERHREREVGTDAEQAKGRAQKAKEALTEAYAADERTAIAKAQKALRSAEEAAADMGLRLEGARRRVERAQREVAGFEASHADALIGELAPEADEVVGRLLAAARELVAADLAWVHVNDRVNTLVRHIPGARGDAPASHSLAGPARDVKRALRGAPLASPMPAWHGRHAFAAGQLAAEQIQEERAERAAHRRKVAAAAGDEAA